MFPLQALGCQQGIIDICRQAARMTRPLKILYTHRTQGVGAEGAHIMGMMEAFRDLGHEVIIDCLPGCSPDDRAGASAGTDTSTNKTRETRLSVLSARIMRIISRCTPQWLFGCLEVIYNVPLLLRLWVALIRHRPDLVYERYALCTFAPAVLCRWFGTPHVIEVNDSVVIERSRPLKLRRISRILEARIMRSASLIVTISGQFKRQLCSNFPLSERKILVCPNAVSERRFLGRSALDADAREALRRRYGIHGRATLGSAGQFVAWHGLDRFVDAMAPLVREMDLFLLFIGDGPTRVDTEATARRLLIEDRIAFTGMVSHDQVPDYLQLLDIAVLPFSNVHGSPMKLMEFMAMGLPVVAPALPPILEVLRDNETGRIFPDSDMPAMSACLRDLLHDREHAKALGNAAREYVARHLTWRAHALSTLAALGQV
jgi:glycosyltransferase involved in cell wall biosynthesis